MSEEKTALFMCRPHRSGRLVLQLNQLIAAGASKIVVEESQWKEQRDALLDACKAWEKYTESENDTRSFDGLRIQYLKKAIKLTETAIKLAEKED